MTKQQAFEQLLSALRLQGFTIVQTGNVMRVVPEADAKLQGGTVVQPRSPSPGGDQLITQVFRLQYESATAMVPILRPLIAPNNTISAYPQNNTLVITDYAENLRRIQRDHRVDRYTGHLAIVEMIPVKYGLAMEIATRRNRVLDEGARAAGQAIDAGQRISILAEPRTNTLIVRAPEPGAPDARQEPDRAARPAGARRRATSTSFTCAMPRPFDWRRCCARSSVLIRRSCRRRRRRSGLSPQSGGTGQPGGSAAVVQA